MPNKPVKLARRFCGPPDSANGGYAAGTLARYVDGPAEVTLRRPPPLERPLAVERDGDRVLMLDGPDLVAEAIPTVLDIAPVEPVDFNAAVAASESSRFLDANAHPFPSCFVCGPLRAPGDGLRVFAGQVPGTDCYAAPWIPTDDDEPTAWAALDCPTSAPIPFTDEYPVALLGRLTVRVDRRPTPGDPHVVMSWRLGDEGRKVFSASSLHDRDGNLCAIARATWIRLPAAP